jgi:hypothetical protein
VGWQLVSEQRAETSAPKPSRVSASGPSLQLQRDRPVSPFGTILARFLEVHMGCLAAVFIDAEGECVDYASQLEIFDALVLGAQLCPLTLSLSEMGERCGAGALVLWVVEASERDLVVRRVSEELTVVVAVSSGSLGARLLRSMAPLAEALRREAGLAAPAWEPWGEALNVQLRPAMGWGYAPLAVVTRDGVSTPVEVLGRWTEHGTISTREVVCFRVSCGGEELTLSHDLSLDRWQRR